MDAVQHVLRLFTRGIICPSETWHSMLRELPTDATESVLNSLPAEAQQLIRDLSLGRASQHPDEEFRAANAAAVAWCEQKVEDSAG